MQHDFYERYIYGAAIPEKIVFDSNTSRFKYIPSPFVHYSNKDLYSRVTTSLNNQLPYVESYKDLYLEQSYNEKTKKESYTAKRHQKPKALLTSLSICESDILVIGETNLWVPMTDKMKDLVSQLKDELDLFRKQT